MPPFFKNAAIHLLLAIVTVAVTGVLGEIILRVKNSDDKNYTIEMWEYARELKTISTDPELGHVHVRNTSASLQGTDISINSLGMRGPEPELPAQGKQTVLLLGSSITLGWGVPEKNILRAELERRLGRGYQVLNGGVGNYNTYRAVRYYEKEWRKTVKPDVIVVHYFVNDAEYLPPSVGNALVRNSQLAVTLYYIAQRFLKGSPGVDSLVDHYKQVYRPDSRGYKDMVGALKRLRDLAAEDGTKVVLSMIPDIHQLENYPFGFIHQRMRALADELGWTFVDFLKSLGSHKGPELWTIPGDPHPNAFVHKAMAEQLAPFIK